MDSSWALLAFLYAFVFAVLLKLIHERHQTKQKLPPGPRPWPVIGNLNLLGPIPHESLHLLSRKYGQLMQLRFGKYPVVVVSSPEMAKQFLKIHDTVFASRPALAGGKYMSYNNSDMVFAPYGPYWQQTRRIFQNEVFNARKLELHDHIRDAERRDFLSSLHAFLGKPIVLRDHLSRYSLASITRMVLGSKYFTESGNDKSIVNMDELKGMVDEWFYLNGVFNIGDWIPCLSFLDLQGYVKKMKALGKKFDRFLNYVVDDHQTRRTAKKNDSSVKDFLDVLLELAEDPNLQVKLTRDCVKALAQNLITGATDTAATTVEWAVHEMLRQPRIIEKAKEELERVIGRNRWVEENDFSELPYINGIIKETMRLHPLATLLAPHYAMEDCNVAGYDISRGTTVLINTWSIGRDPNSWDAPLEFLPERFLGKQIDMMGSNFALLPFGSGRRRCPGYRLGLKTVQTTLANLLHGFDMKLGEGMKPEDHVCMEEEYGLTTHPNVPVTIIMEPTLPPHLY